VFRALPEVRPLLSDLSFAFDAAASISLDADPTALAELPARLSQVLALTDVDLSSPF